jgi:hypothetical protein
MEHLTRTSGLVVIETWINSKFLLLTCNIYKYVPYSRNDGLVVTGTWLIAKSLLLL